MFLRRAEHGLPTLGMRSDFNIPAAASLPSPQFQICLAFESTTRGRNRRTLSEESSTRVGMTSLQGFALQTRSIRRDFLSSGKMSGEVNTDFQPPVLTYGP